ncbi:uncharacterized protein LOC120821731 isoform X2 [Gasterosteus aculeatus]
MKLLLSSLLLASFCALSSWSVSSAGEPAVSQTPDVSVVEGETAEISCCWTLEYQSLRVTWLKNHTEIKSNKMMFKNSSHGSLSDKTSNCSHLTLMNVTRDDSGRYICEVTVEIPNLNKAQGNGTVLTVTAKDNATVHATRVIYEVPHIDSEEVEMDKHSTSSSKGSSQWCQVPVYESFDYFERVETKESG